MLKFKIVLVILFISLKHTITAQHQGDVKVIEVPELLKITSEGDEKPRVINFWATWCKPCVKEMPLFMAAAKEFPEVEFIFISLDFADQVQKAQAFALKKGMDAHALYLIDDLDYNSWIDKVSPEWSGAIPATFFIDSNGKTLYEQEFEPGELMALLKSKLKTK